MGYFISLAFMKRLPLCLLALAGWLLSGCQKETTAEAEKGGVQLQFANVAGSGPLALNTTLTNAFGETLTLTKYKYYVTNIALTDERNLKHFLPDTYFLIDESKAESKTVSLEAPAGTYNAVSFLLGVDSTRNVSGAQTGALDPLHDMFWTWNTGYIMAKLEGTSPQSTQVNNKVEYHIGGFRGEHSALRTITLPLGQTFAVQKGKTLRVAISADVLSWFNAVHALKIADAPVAMTPGVLSSRFADNYARMFSVTSVQQQ